MEIATTPTENSLPFIAADFSNLSQALDYAAQGVTGCNFFDGRGKMRASISYHALKYEAQILARQLLGLGLERGARVALVAETNPAFLRFFFACQYAGLVPVPLPTPVVFTSKAAYVFQIQGMLKSCAAAAAMAPTEYLSSLIEASAQLGKEFYCGTPEDFYQLAVPNVITNPLQGYETAYIQYTSGSTRFPRGVVVKQHAVMNNLAGIIKHGLNIGSTDRLMSWLPFYHDMGFVGLVLVPVTSQLSVDYLPTRDFAARPRQWLSIMSKTKATVSSSPPFGYELVSRRLRSGEAEELDLSAWRVAGVGAEMIRAQTLAQFAKILKPAGFDKYAFVSCYGMAECSLGVSFTTLNQGIVTDSIDADILSEKQQAVSVGNNKASLKGCSRVRSFVKCGYPLPDYDVEIRNDQGQVLGQRCSGTIFLRGPSIMSGYFNDAQNTATTLSSDGWLNTGDEGYWLGKEIVVTGRKKDLIIINGRNIWPQDLEYLAEQHPEVRTGDALAFSVPDRDGEETTVMVVQCREQDEAKRAKLITQLRQQIHIEMGVCCYIELVPLHTLPRTSSGKLSRSMARHNFIKTQNWQGSEQVQANVKAI